MMTFDEGWPVKLQKLIDEERIAVEVVLSKDVTGKEGCDVVDSCGEQKRSI